MLLKENFTKVYASTETEPTEKELEYIFSIAEEINTNSPDYTQVSGETYCECEESGEQDDIWLFLVNMPFKVYDFEEERTLSIIFCPECHKWSLCD